MQVKTPPPPHAPMPVRAPPPPPPAKDPPAKAPPATAAEAPPAKDPPPTSSAMSEKWHALDVASRDVPAIGHHGFGYLPSAIGCLEDGQGEGERAEREKGRAEQGTGKRRHAAAAAAAATPAAARAPPHPGQADGTWFRALHLHLRRHFRSLSKTGPCMTRSMQGRGLDWRTAFLPI